MSARPKPFAAASLALVLGLAACSGHGPGTGGPRAAAESPADRGGAVERGQQVTPGIAIGPNRSFARVTYRPAVKQVAESGFADTLAAVSPDGHVLVFHDAPADIRALKAGDVMLIKNQLVRKVLGAEDDGAETYIVTDRATIGDVVQDGEINIDAPLVFSSPPAAKLQPPRPPPDLLGLLIPSAYAQISPGQAAAQKAESQGTQKAATAALGCAVTSGWTVSQVQSTTAGNSLNYSLVLVKNLQGFIGKVGASGFINNFRFWSDLNVANGVIAGLRTGLNGITGKLHFDWEVAKGTPGSWNIEDPVKLPGLLSVPLAPLLGGLPLTLEMSSAILIHPALTGGNQIQTGGFTITVNGNMSGSVASGGAVPEGSSIDQTFQITNDSGLSAVAPDAMVIAYAAPRFELLFSAFGSFKLGSALKMVGGANSKPCSLTAIQYPAWQRYAGIAAKLADKYAPGLSGMVLNGISDVLKSKADVYAQLVSTEGVVHASTLSLVPCSKKWIEFSAQVGTAANIAGLTPDAKRSATVFSKKYSKADPPSNFCEKVGS
jgi:hypothetical protein